MRSAETVGEHRGGSGLRPAFVALLQQFRAPRSALHAAQPVLALFVGWRFLLFLTSLVASQFASQGAPSGLDVLLRWSTDRWDAGWYLAIARDGYSLAETGQSNIAFYPLLPALIRLLAEIGLPWRAAGAIIVHAALLGALLYLYALVQLDHDEPTAMRAVVALLVFPTAIFLTAVYTESLLLLTMIAAVYHARRGQWWVAGLWGLAAGLTKLVGAAVVVALLWELGRVVWREGPRRRHLADLAALALPPLGALSYLGYVQWRFGSYQIYFKAQEEWYRQSAFHPFFPDGWGFLTAFLHGEGQDVINYFYPQGGTTLPSPNAFMVLDLLFLLVALVVGILLCLRARVSYGLFILAVLGTAAWSGSPQSLNRIALILFPLPIAFALAGRNRAVGFLLLLLSGMLSVYHTFLFVNGFWAG